MYIYIYICVCVCVCVCAFEQQHNDDDLTINTFIANTFFVMSHQTVCLSIWKLL